MKGAKIILLAAVLSALPGKAGWNVKNEIVHVFQNELPYQVGEEISYRVHYGLMNAGVATIKVKEEVKLLGNTTYHMVGTGHSVGMVDWLFPTIDRYETYIDQETLLPVRFIRDVDEGGYIIKRDVVFDRKNNQAKDYHLDPEKDFDLPKNIQDIFSAFYYARALDASNLNPGEIINIPVFLDHEIFPFKIKFVKREYIKTKFGNIQCLKFVPIVQEGRVFKEEDDMHLWISDDRNHVPVRIKSELLVGSIKVDLNSYSGLVAPLNIQ